MHAGHLLLVLCACPECLPSIVQDTWWTLAKWVVAFPVTVYTIAKWEYAKSDRMFGRPERKFM